MAGFGLEPRIPVVLGVSRSLYQVLAGDLEAALHQALGDTFRKLMATLGVPGQPAVTVAELDRIRPAPAWQEDNHPLFRLWVNGRPCRYPRLLPQRVFWYVQAQPFAPGPSAEEVQQWLLALAAAPEPAKQAMVLDFFRLSCAEIVRTQPSVLLSQQQAQAYADHLPVPAHQEGSLIWPPPVDWLAPALALTLQQAVSLADQATVAQVVQAAWQNGSQAADAAEALLAALMPERIRVCISPQYLQTVTTVATPEIIPLMREALFDELGMRYPAIEFTLVEDLQPYAFAFQINHLMALPWIGLKADEALVDAALTTLGERPFPAGSRAARNPATHNEATLVLADLAAGLGGHTTWNCWSYLVLALSGELRQNGSVLLSQRMVDAYLDEVATVYAVLVDTFRARWSLMDLTRCLRRLLAEQVSIRDMRCILERLCDFDYIVADDARSIVFDERLAVLAEPTNEWLSDPDNLAEFVRQGLKASISHKVSRGQSTLVVLLLAPDLEDVLRSSRVYGPAKTTGVAMGEEREEEIVHQIDVELGHFPLPPAVLTSSTVRPALRALLAQAMPDVPVLSYQELSLTLNISPLARVSLAGS